MKIRKSPEPTDLDLAIDELYEELRAFEGHEEEHRKITERIVTLTQLKENSPKRVDLNSVIAVAGNLSVALVIIGFEKHHVITTKVGSFLTKLR